MSEPNVPAQHRIAVVTGVDNEMFDQLFLLNATIRVAGGGVALKVCDFGLEPAQQDFLRAKDMLLPRPPGIDDARHAWYYKASLGRYIEGLAADAVVWLDADLLILDGLMPHLARICDDLARNDFVLAATGSGSLRDQLAGDPAPGYAKLVERHDLSLTYLSSGFFICKSTNFLNEWSAQARALPYELLFEQNAFNLVALDYPGRVRILDPLVWNLAANELRHMDIAVEGDRVQVRGPHGKTLIAHATSIDRARDLILLSMLLTADSFAINPKVRMISGPEALFEAQKRLLINEMSADLPLLRACGLGTET